MPGWGGGSWGSSPWGNGEAAVVAPTIAVPAARGRTERAPEEGLGIDFDVLDDLPPTFRLTQGRPNLANAIARRWSTPQGFLARFGGDANYGRDVRGRLNTAWSFQELSGLAAELEDECLLDERVESASVTVSHDLATSTLTAEVDLEVATGTFRFIMKIDAVSVEVLRPE